MAGWNYGVLENEVKLPLNCGNNRSEGSSAQLDVVLSTAVRFEIAIRDCGWIGLFCQYSKIKLMSKEIYRG